MTETDELSPVLHYFGHARRAQQAIGAANAMLGGRDTTQKEVTIGHAYATIAVAEAALALIEFLRISSVSVDAS